MAPNDGAARRNGLRRSPSAAAVLEHKNHPDTELAKRIAATALAAVSEIDEERGAIYLDLIHAFLKSTPGVLEDAMTSVAFKYHSDFARRYVAQGIAEGRAEGQAEGRLEIILELLATRFGLLPESIQTRVRGASAAQLYAVGKSLLTAQTLEEILGSLD